MTPECPACAGSQWVWLLEKDGFHLWRCRRCRLIRVAGSWPSLHNEDTLPSWYRGYLERWIANRKCSGPGYSPHARLDVIERWVEPGALLDVGCGAGDLLGAAATRGWSPAGVEPYGPAAQAARDRGFQVEHETWEDVRVPAEAFTAVTFLDSLEHMNSPLASLRKAALALKRGGIVVITTPDADSWLARLLGRRWPNLFPMEHRFCFGGRSLDLVVRRTGFHPLEYRRVGYHRSLGWLVHKAVRTSSRSFEGCRLALPLPVGDLMCVAVKS